MLKKIGAFLGLILISFTVSSWGWVGHYNISYRASLSFNSEMSSFSSWIQTLADSASVADDRKSSDPAESAKHYIDIDNYSEFLQNGYISQSLATVISLHGNSNVYSWGILPWATITAYDSLVSCFQRHDFNKALFFASDLGHYVGDGHMPLHITKNFNGDDTGNSGIHSRYESTMINGYISQITYTGSTISAISNVPNYIFSYLYENYQYLDSVLIADNAAKAVNSTYTSTAYKAELWNRSKGFTTMLLKNASHALAELIYTAWSQAGKPSIIETSVPTLKPVDGISLNKISPNPFAGETKISFTLPRQFDSVSLVITDLKGNVVKTLCNEPKSAGTYDIILTAEDLAQGVYLMILKADSTKISRKIILLR
jgi:hypothetical protein